VKAGIRLSVSGLFDNPDCTIGIGHGLSGEGAFVLIFWTGADGVNDVLIGRGRALLELDGRMDVVGEISLL